MTEFLKRFNPLVVLRRYKQRRYNWNDEGIQYPGFKYYPRHPDFKDPPYEPSKLFRVQRIKQLKGVPFYERKILEEFGLAGQKPDVKIIKNIPENNQRLWKVKHLVQIVPVTFPDGFPKDNQGTYLNENGVLKVMKELVPVDDKLQVTEQFRRKPERLDGDTLRRNSRIKWLNAWE